MTIPHKIYVSSISSGDNKANIRFAQKGSITAIKFTYCGLSGGDVTGSQRFELSKQSASSFTLNDTPASVLAYWTGGAVSVVSSQFCLNDLLAGLNIPYAAGDTIYLHELISGTAPSSGLVMVTLYATS